MKKIAEIDKNISLQLNELTKVADKIDFIEICSFKVKSEIIEIPWDEIAHTGIYLIEIKNDNKHKTFESWIDKFRKDWEDEKYLKKFVPNLKKKRIGKHSELNEWIPLYIGKSKNIGGRLKDHIYQNLNKTTFALKLLARENLKAHTFRLSVIKLDVENYNHIVPFIESHMRERINPIIGKQ
jgi:hypothetical protein